MPHFRPTDVSQVRRRNVDRIDTDYQIRMLAANLLDFMMARDLEKSAQVH